MQKSKENRIPPIRSGLRVLLIRENPFFGPGPDLLLQQIERTQSVSEASKETGISYSKCWKMIRQIEKELGCGIVARKTGGTGGGNSVLTEKGRDLLRRYERFTARCKERMLELYEEEFAGFDE